MVASALAVGCCFVTSVQAQTAKFLGEDRVAQGSWRNLYGKGGYYLPYTAVSLPSYASIGATGQYDHVWAGNTADPRALERVGESYRTAACWHNLTFDINLTFTDSQPHRVSLYCLDWDTIGRRQIIEIRDAGTNALLDSRAIANFQGGSYLRWNISGSVRIVVTNNAPGLNAVLSGVFFDPPTMEPAWWTQGPTPVIDPSALPDNKAVPNIGQAKWMAKGALAALRKVNVETADAVEADLVGPGKIIPSWDAPSGPEAIAAQRGALVVGQLKAMAAPFYEHLHAKDPLWLASQRSQNRTSAPGSHFPWTTETADDSNKSLASIGQLKSVFSLHFENFPIRDDDDADGVMESQDADPDDTTVGKLSVSITSPLSGVIVR